MASGGNRDDRRKKSKEGGHNVKLSKMLSYTLRHGANKDGLHISSDGYVNVSQLLRTEKFKGFKLQDLEKVVEENDKKRFTLKEEGGEYFIRANQGHSIDVPDLELEKLQPGDLDIAIHGTYEKCIDRIKKDGLSRMGRRHIHMAASEPGIGDVISGMRQTCDFIVRVNVSKALAGGIEFFRSANNVILSPGNEEGIIPPLYFHGIKRRQNK